MLLLLKNKKYVFTEKLEDFALANKDTILFAKAWKANDTIKYTNLAETLNQNHDYMVLMNFTKEKQPKL